MARSGLKHYGDYEIIELQSNKKIIQLWIYRILVLLEGHRKFIRSSDFEDDSIAQAIRLGHWIDVGDKKFKRKKIKRELKELSATFEQKNKNIGVDKCLKINVEHLSCLVQLSDVERRILELVILIHSEEILEDAVGLLGNLSTRKLFRVISKILNISESKVKDSMGCKSKLAQSGLVTIDRRSNYSLSEKLELLSASFADTINSIESDPIQLIKDTVASCTGPKLNVTDYGHLSRDLDLLGTYLNTAIQEGRKGVNIFIYGAPGTGKTELAKVLAQNLQCDLFSIVSEDEDGDPIYGEKRLRAFRVAQSFLSEQKNLLLFDEVEDIFNDGSLFLGTPSTAKKNKAWMNKSLEENPVPTLWISNSSNDLDPAIVRRFDMVIELPVPPMKQRLQIVQNICSDLLDDQTMNRVSSIESLAPAVIARAASVVRSIGEELSQSDKIQAFENIVNNTLEVQGHKPIVKNDPNRLPETYNPSYICADTDVKSLAEGLEKTQAGRICMYGPPGTGKTAYGRWLAERLDIPLNVKKASDLISMWVGGTEKNIANAFKQAEADGALLLIDEVDSFLQDRRGARNSWEVTAVNEMLTQMESFSGIFIASTNLMEGLDQAALRRFDIKLKFDYLQPEQSFNLLLSTCKQLGIADPNADDEDAVRKLANVTPGDFAAITRRNRFQSIKTAYEFVAALKGEGSLKEGGNQRSIGFM